MTLLEGEIGKTYKVVEIKLENTAKRRFEILGMTLGSHITVVNAKRAGAVIIKIRRTRFAVGRDFAAGIIIKEEAVER